MTDDEKLIVNIFKCIYFMLESVNEFLVVFCVMNYLSVVGRVASHMKFLKIGQTFIY